MRPVNSDGSAWSAEMSRMIGDHLANEVSKELRAYDDAMGIPPDGKVYRVEELNSGEVRYYADPVLAEKRSKGDDFDALWRRRCAEFCAEPRDENEWRRKLMDSRRETDIDLTLRTTADVADRVGRVARKSVGKQQRATAGASANGQLRE